MNSLTIHLSFTVSRLTISITTVFLFIIQLTSVHAAVLVNINLRQPEHHIAEVIIDFPGETCVRINFHLPIWRTGRYEILNLDNDIRELSALDEQSNKLA